MLFSKSGAVAQIVLLSLAMESCTTANLLYRGETTTGVVEVERRSYDRTYDALGCALSFALYGGWCWSYFFENRESETNDILQHGRKKMPGEIQDETVEFENYNYSMSIRNRPSDTPFIPLNQVSLSWSTSIVDATAKRGSEKIASGMGRGESFDTFYRSVDPGWSWGIEPFASSSRVQVNDAKPKDTTSGYNHDEGSRMPYIEREFPSGEFVDELYHNSYTLKTQALGARLGVAYTLLPYPELTAKERWNCVGHCGPLLFYQARLSFAPVAYRRTEIAFDSQQFARSGWSPMDNYSAGASILFMHRGIHSLFGIHLDVVAIPKLKLNEEVEFRASYVFDEETNAYLRERVYTNTIELLSSSLQLSYSYVW